MLVGSLTTVKDPGRYETGKRQNPESFLLFLFKKILLLSLEYGSSSRVKSTASSLAIYLAFSLLPKDS